MHDGTQGHEQQTKEHDKDELHLSKDHNTGFAVVVGNCKGNQHIDGGKGSNSLGYSLEHVLCLTFTAECSRVSNRHEFVQDVHVVLDPFADRFSSSVPSPALLDIVPQNHSQIQIVNVKIANCRISRRLVHFRSGPSRVAQGTSNRLFGRVTNVITRSFLGASSFDWILAASIVRRDSRFPTLDRWTGQMNFGELIVGSPILLEQRIWFVPPHHNVLPGSICSIPHLKHLTVRVTRVGSRRSRGCQGDVIPVSLCVHKGTPSTRSIDKVPGTSAAIAKLVQNGTVVFLSVPKVTNVIAIWSKVAALFKISNGIPRGNLIGLRTVIQGNLMTIILPVGGSLENIGQFLSLFGHAHIGNGKGMVLSRLFGNIPRNFAHLSISIQIINVSIIKVTEQCILLSQPDIWNHMDTIFCCL
mmetsp:Transcript_41593/g.100182  ORF Transcript_41593/g.100182 Transcript_41593/m.100182 type:complete len:414 (-) Transcript_41593:954-2195(-)